MGLLDSGPLSSPDAQIMLAAGLLGGRGNLGANLGQGLLGAVQAQQQERANRANDLQQIQGLYKIALENDQLRAIDDEEAKRPHVRDPNLVALESRMAQLSGMPALSNQGPVASRVPGVPAPMGMQPPGMPQGGMPAPAPMPGMAPPSASPMANPGYQPPAAQVQQRGQAEAQQVQQQQQIALADAMRAIQRQGDRYAIMGMTPIAQERYKQLDPITTKYGVYFRDPRNPGQVILGGGMIPKDAMPVTIGPDGQQSIAPLPGQLKTAAQNAAAQSFGKEAGEFPFRVQTVKLASGAEVPQFVSNAVGNPNIGGLPFLSSLFGNQGMPSASPQPNAPPQPAPQGLPQAAPAPSAPAPKVAQVTVTQPSKQAQAVPQDDPWATMPKIQIPQGIGQTTYQANLDKLRAERAAALSEKYGGAAATAQDRKATNNQAMDLVDSADTGIGASMIGDVKNLLISRFGIPATDFSNDPNATVALNKDLMQAAVKQAKAQFGARMSTNEVNNMLKRGAPNGDMMKGAIKFLLTLDNAKADYETQQANDLGRFLGNHGDPLQFEGWYSGAFPLHKTLDQIRLAPNTGNSTAPGWKVERVQ